MRADPKGWLIAKRVCEQWQSIKTGNGGKLTFSREDGESEELENGSIPRQRLYALNAMCRQLSNLGNLGMQGQSAINDD